MAYSDDLRLLVVLQSYDYGWTAKEVAEALFMSVRTVRRIRQQFALTGSHERKRKEPSDAGTSLAEEELNTLKKIVDANPDLFLDEMAQQLALRHGAEHSRATVCRALRHLGYSHKALRHVARRRNTELRLIFRSQICEFRPSQLVFLDETCTNSATLKRRRGWARRGSALRHATFSTDSRSSVCWDFLTSTAS